MESMRRCLEGCKKIDLHILLVPASSWRADLRYADRSAYVESTSAGFVRVAAETTLIDLRAEILNQLEVGSLPQTYIFLRSIGRCLTWIAPKQELFLRTHLFVPPSAVSPEIYLLDSKLLGDQYCIPPHSQEHIRPKQRVSDGCAQRCLAKKAEHQLRMRKLTVPPIGHYSGRESYRPHHSTVSLPFPLMGCVDTITISCSDSMPQREVGTSDACTPPQSYSRYSRHSSSDSSSSRTITPTSPLNKTRVSGRPYGTLDQLDYLLAWRGREKHPQHGMQTGNSSMQRSQLHKQMAVSTPRAKCSAATDPTTASDSVLQIEMCYTNGLQKPVNPPPPTPTLAALSEREESTAQLPPYMPRVVTKASVSSSDPVMASESQDFPSNKVGCAGDATQQSDSRDGERGHSMQASLENKDLFVGMLVTQSPTNLLDAHHSPLLPPEDRLLSDDSMQHRDTTSGTQPIKRHLKVNSTAEEGNIPRVVTKASVSSSDPVVASESQDFPSNKVGCAGDATQQSDSRDGERGYSMQASLENKDLFVGMLVTQPPTSLLDAHHSPLLPPEDWVPSDDSMQHRDTTLGTKPSKRHSEVNSTAQGGNASVKPAAGTHPSSNPLLDSAKDVYAASCGERVFPLAKDGASSSTENDSRANPVFHNHNPAGSDPTAPTSRKVFHKVPYSPAMDGGVSATTTAKPARCDEASGANAGHQHASESIFQQPMPTSNIKSYMDDLKNMKQECEELNAVRTKMGLKMRHLQSLQQRKREEGEERWKKSFFAEKKRFVVLEDKMKELRGSLRALQKAAEEESLRRLSNILIQCRRLKAFIERLQERLSSVKENVFKEQQAHQTLLLECKALRDELIAKKIAFTKVRTGAL